LAIDDDQIKSLIESNPHYRIREITEIIDVSQETVINHLYTHLVTYLGTIFEYLTI